MTSARGAAARRTVVAGVCLPDHMAPPRRGAPRTAPPQSSSPIGLPAVTEAVLASRGVAWAVERAVQTGRPLRVLAVTAPGPDGAALPVDKACAGAEVADVLCSRRPGLNAVVEIVHGDPVDQLSAASRDADLVVVDGTGDGRSDAVVARARCPVTVIPAHARLGIEATAPIVVGVKDLAGSAHLVRFAALEALRTERPLIALHSWTYPGPRVHDEAMAVLGSEKERLLAELVDPIVAALPTLTVHQVVTQGRAEEALVAASQSAALVVLGSREERWRSPVLLGATRRGILDGVACPAATVPDAPALSLA